MSVVTVTHVTPTPTIQVLPDTGLNAKGLLFVDLMAAVPDPGGDDQFTYAWSVTDPSGQPFTNFVANGAAMSFTETASDTYTVSLTVKDDDGGNASASTPILTVAADKTLTPTAPPGSAQVLAIALGAN